MHSPSTPIHSHPTESSKLQSGGSVRFPPEPPRAVLERCRRGISPPSHSNGARPWHVSPNHSSRASDVSRPFLKSVPRSVRFPGNPPRGSSLGPVETSTQGGKAAIPGALSGFRSHRPMHPPPPPGRRCSGESVESTRRFRLCSVSAGGVGSRSGNQNTLQESRPSGKHQPHSQVRRGRDLRCSRRSKADHLV